SKCRPSPTTLSATAVPGAESPGDSDMKIVPSLSFRGQCREAFEFYARVLDGKITAAMPYGDMPAGDMPVDPKYKDWLMHCWLDVGDQSLMGADMDRSEERRVGRGGGTGGRAERRKEARSG